MTYDEFKAIEHRVIKERDFYCYKNAVDYYPKEEDIAKYNEYKERAKKIDNFKKKVITEALKKLSKDFFN